VSRRDRERAQNGLLFRDGKYVPREEFLEEARKASEDIRVVAEEAKKNLAAVDKWIKGQGLKVPLEK